jgi:hypothetical protein
MQQSEEDTSAFLQSLVLQPEAAPTKSAAPSASTTSTTTTASKPRVRRHPGLYDRVIESLANVAALAAAGLLWWIGAQFTLAFVTSLGADLSRLGAGQWVIPAFVTAIEIKFWPHQGTQRNLVWLFLIVAGFDLLTSVLGGAEWLAGRAIGSAITLPQSGTLLWAMSLGAAALCAFWPERLARTAVTELRKIWSI